MGQTSFGQDNLPKGFNLYLLPDKIKVGQQIKLDIKKLKPKGEPVISTGEIHSYLKDRHEIRFHYEGADKLKALRIPAEGKPFIAFVGDVPIYTGALAAKNFKFRNEMIHISVENLAGDFPTLTIEPRNYALTTPPFADLRADERIMQWFAARGVLYEQLWLVGKCKKIIPTLKRSLTSVFIFSVTEVSLGKFDEREIEFEPYQAAGAELFGALSLDGNRYDASHSFDTDTEFRLKFERQITEKPPRIYYIDYEFVPYRSSPNEKLTLPAPKTIVRVEIEPNSFQWFQPDELLKLLPRFVAAEGTYPERQAFQRGSFVLKSGRIIKWTAAGKSSLMLSAYCQDKPCEQLFVLRDEENQTENQDENLYRIWDEERKQGFINQTGEVVIVPQFDDVSEFSEGLVGVRVGEKWGYADRTGKIVIATRWKQVSSFFEGVAPVEEGQREYQSNDGNFTLKSCSYVDKSGRYLFEPSLERKFTACPYFVDGLAKICFPDALAKYFPTFPHTGKCGYIDRTGAWAFEPQTADKLKIFEDERSESASRRQTAIARKPPPEKLVLKLLHLITIGEYEKNVLGYQNENGKYVWISPAAWGKNGGWLRNKLDAEWWRENYVGKQPLPEFPR